MPKKKRKAAKTVSPAMRTKIMAEAEGKGLTADQVAKKYGISKWTFYGWKQKISGPAARKTRGSGAKTAAIDPKMLRTEIRAVLPGILREELARALGVLAKGKR